MHIVINLAFCGSVAGNRYFMDCPDQFKKYKTCEEWIKSKPEELKEAYWKIKGKEKYVLLFPFCHCNAFSNP
jgi:hypothetical protein